jgi:hypothetical protein
MTKANDDESWAAGAGPSPEVDGERRRARCQARRAEHSLECCPCDNDLRWHTQITIVNNTIRIDATTRTPHPVVNAHRAIPAGSIVTVVRRLDGQALVRYIAPSRLAANRGDPGDPGVSHAWVAETSIVQPAPGWRT